MKKNNSDFSLWKQFISFFFLQWNHTNNQWQQSDKIVLTLEINLKPPRVNNFKN